MLSSLKKSTPIADLEASVADAKANLDRVRAAFRGARLDFEDAKALVAGSKSLDNLAAHRLALEDVQAASEAVALANDNVKAAEQALDLARTMPMRQATAKLPEAAADAIVKAMPALRLALAQMIEALDAASFAEIAGASTPGTLFASMIHNANAAATGGDAENFIEELRAYSRGILDGSKPATLQATLAEQRAGLLRKTA